MLSQLSPFPPLRTVLLALVAALAPVLIAGCGRNQSALPPTVAKFKVAASIFPLADLAKQIGGDDVEAVTLLPSGVTEHGFEPQPQQVEQLATSRLLLVVGLGLDPWAERSAKAAGRQIVIVRFADAVGLDHVKPAAAHEDAGETDEGEHGQDHVGDPHLWLDPVLMKAFVPAVVDAMAKLDSGHADAYRRRGKAYAAELDKLDAEYRAALANVKSRAFVSFHSAFTYLAARYGLIQAAVFGAHVEGLGPQPLEHVINFVKEHKIKVVFAEPQFPADRLSWLAEQTGVSVGKLDPLGNPSVTGYASYLEMMRSNLKELVKALSE